MSENFKEPWEVRHSPPYIDIEDANGQSVLSGDGWYDLPQHTKLEHYRRIAACVNLCRGMDLEAIERGDIVASRTVSSLSNTTEATDL